MSKFRKISACIIILLLLFTTSESFAHYTIIGGRKVINAYKATIKKYLKVGSDSAATVDKSEDIYAEDDIECGGDFINSGTAIGDIYVDEADFTDANISTSDIATNNVSTSKHGFTPKLSNIATQFLNGQGAYSTPAGIAAAYVSQAFSTQTSINVSHSFGAYPDAQVIDGSGELLIPLTITHNSINDFTVTFSASRSGNILATLGAPQLNSYVNTGVNYTMVAADYLIEETGADTTVTLLTVVGRSGKIIIVKNTSSGNITIAAAGGETIDEDASITVASFAGVALFADGSSTWHII